MGLDLTRMGMAAEAESLLQNTLFKGALEDWRAQAMAQLLDTKNLESEAGKQAVHDATRKLQLAQAFEDHLKLFASNLDDLDGVEDEEPEDTK